MSWFDTLFIRGGCHFPYQDLSLRDKIIIKDSNLSVVVYDTGDARGKGVMYVGEKPLQPFQICACYPGYIGEIGKKINDIKHMKKPNLFQIFQDYALNVDVVYPKGQKNTYIVYPVSLENVKEIIEKEKNLPDEEVDTLLNELSTSRFENSSNARIITPEEVKEFANKKKLKKDDAKKLEKKVNEMNNAITNKYIVGYTESVGTNDPRFELLKNPDMNVAHNPVPSNIHFANEPIGNEKPNISFVSRFRIPNKFSGKMIYVPFYALTEIKQYTPLVWNYGKGYDPVRKKHGYKLNEKCTTE